MRRRRSECALRERQSNSGVVGEVAMIGGERPDLAMRRAVMELSAVCDCSCAFVLFWCVLSV